MTLNFGANYVAAPIMKLKINPSLSIRISSSEGVLCE